MSCFFGTYIDDIRSGGPSERACRSASRRIASKINYFGQQDAPRKRGHPSKRPRAWAGVNCVARETDGLYVFSTLGKWEKVRKIVDKWLVRVMEAGGMLDYKELEKDVGFSMPCQQNLP